MLRALVTSATSKEEALGDLNGVDPQDCSFTCWKVGLFLNGTVSALVGDSFLARNLLKA